MKKLIILLMLLMAGLTFGQTKGARVGGGTVWTDSLGYGSVATSDSVWILDVNFSQDWYKFIVEGNANSPVDSFVVQAGTVRYDEGRDAVDTIWGSWSTVKDSVWGDINTMINNSVGKDFILFDPVAQLLRFKLLNARANLTTRNCVITVQAIKY